MKNIPSALLITGALDLSNCMEMFETDLDADSSRPSPKYVEFHPLHSKSVNNLMQQLAYQVFDDEDPTKLNKKFKIFGKLIDAICHKYDRWNPLTLVFCSVESFTSGAISDFIHLISNHQDRLPVSMIFTISSKLAISTSFLKKIKSFALKNLKIQTFEAKPPGEIFNDALELTFFGPATENCDFEELSGQFYLGHRIFDQLAYKFLQVDYNIENFYNSLKALAVNHFLQKVWKSKARGRRLNCEPGTEEEDSLDLDQTLDSDENCQVFAQHHSRFFKCLKVLHKFAYPEMGAHLRNTYSLLMKSYGVER